MEEDVMPGQCAFPHSSSRFEDSKIEFDNDTEGKDFSDEAISDISVQLNKILEMMGVSEEMRLDCKQRSFKQGIINTITTRLTGGPDLVCVFGSCIEGSAIRAMAPDVDCIHVFKARVINNASEGINESASYLIIQDTWTFPGYVKLQKVSFGNALRKTDRNDDLSLIPDKCGSKSADGVYSIEGVDLTDAEPLKLDEEDTTIWLIKQCVNLQIRFLAKVEEVCDSMETRIRCWENMYLQLKRMQIPSTLLGSDDSAIDIVKRTISLQINLSLTYCYAVQAIATPDESERLHLIGLTRDCASGLFNARLTYLTMLFKLNRLSECKEILRDLDGFYGNDSDTETYYCPCRHFMTCSSLDYYLKEDIESTFKNQITCMVIMPAEKEIVLEPLDLELYLPIDYKDSYVKPGDYIPQFNRQWASVDGWVYFYFIRYLVYSGLNDVTMKIDSIKYICCAATCGQLFHEAVAYNLVGWILAREGMLKGALNWWRKSLERHPRRNAVNRYCVDFFSKCVGLGKDFKPLSQSTHRSIHHDVVLYHRAQPLVPNPVPTLARPSDA